MLATIAFYWFVMLPGVITGLVLLKRFKDALEAKESKERVRATVRNR